MAAEILNNSINNAKAQCSIKELNCDVCITSNQSELLFSFDSGDELILQLTEKQRQFLAKLLSGE